MCIFCVKRGKNMNKTLSVILSICILLSIFTAVPFTANAIDTDIAETGYNSGTTGDCTWTLDDNGVLTISGNGKMGDYDSYSSKAPWGTAIKKVVIENGVTRIGDSAFYHCTGLTSVTIPNSVTSIGDTAFYRCTGLTSITVSKGNAVYDSRNNCNAIIKTETNELIVGCKNTVIPDSVTSIGDSAFYRCTGLTSVTIPDSVTRIDDDAFYECTGLTSVTIGNSVTDIGWSAFSGCTGLTSVTIPDSVTSIGGRAFYGCTGLTSVTIPDSVTSIGDDAFGYYYYFYEAKVSNFTIYGNKGTAAEQYAVGNGFTFVPLGEMPTEEPTEAPAQVIRSGYTGDCTWTLDDNGVLTISGNGKMGEYNHFSQKAPWGTEIKKVVIKNGVTSIGYWAFEDCTGLTSITIPNSVKSIGGSAFYNCTGLTSVTIGNSIESIDGYAFSGCTGLRSVTIPDSVRSIGNYAFCYCSGLTSISVSLGNTVYDSRNNCNAIIKTKTNELIVGCKSTVIPDSVTRIGNYAFSGCTGLTSVTIPDSVTSIGKYAFGYYYDSNKGVYVKVNDFTIYGNKGTAAEQYADKNGFTFVPLGETPTEEPTEAATKPSTEPPTNPSAQIILGDADADGDLTILDATRIQRWLAELCDMNGGVHTGAALIDSEIKSADADEDGDVTILDATSIQRHIADLPTHEGIGEPIA